MTPRETRLLRLLRLCERQHDAASLHVRAARSQLVSAQAALNDTYERTRAAQLCRIAAASDSNPEEWLLACADVEANTRIAAHQQVQLAHTEPHALSRQRSMRLRGCDIPHLPRASPGEETSKNPS